MVKRRKSTVNVRDIDILNHIKSINFRYVYTYLYIKKQKDYKWK